MISVKIIFRTDKVNSDGEHPLYLRIIKNRKPKYISLQIYLKPEQWNDEDKKVRKSHPYAQALNQTIASKILEANNVALDLERSDKSVAPNKIKDQIMGRSSESFIKYGERYLLELENNGQMGTLDKAKSVMSKLKEYLGKRDLMFDEVTVSWLKNYEIYLRVKLGNKINTVHSNLKVIRKLINEAINEELLPYEKNPFLRFKLKWENVRKEYLSEDELHSLELLELQPGSRKDVHRNMYVFAAYAGGMRISDILLLRWKYFDGKNIMLHTKKTNTVLSLPVPDKAIEIIEQYRSEVSKPDHFIFPILKNELDYSNKRLLFRSISSATAYTNTDLKDFEEMLELNKHIHFHTSRHTFATRALRKGMRIEYVSQLLTHASIKTTQGYTKIENQDLDKAMKVMNG